MSPSELWKRGIPLSEAWFQFSSDKLYLKFKFPRLSKTIDPTGLQGFLLRHSSEQNDRRALEKHALRMQHLSELNSHHSKVQRAMESDVHDQLQNRQLVAYGYLAGRNIKAQPVEIPERFLEVKFIKWEFDTISTPPYEFSQVRIIDPEMINEREHQIRRPAILAKRGRPSVQTHIIESIISLNNENPTQLQGLHKTLVPIIRNRIHELHPNEYDPNKPAERTIMKSIRSGRKAIATAKSQ